MRCVSRRVFIQQVGAASAAFWLAESTNAAEKSAAPPRPNIVVFLVDDMGWEDTSEPFYKEVTELNRRYRTPNMEALAREGLKFTQAYACALCSPTRVSLMTGLNAARHRVTNWTLRKNISPDPDSPDMKPPYWNVNGLSPVPGIERTIHVKPLPMFLREAGYRTIHVGKAHWGAEGTPGEEPKNLGFDVNIAGHSAGGPGSYHGKRNYSAAWRSTNSEDRIWDVPGLEAYHGTNTNLTEALTREANKTVDDAVAAGSPFFLYMAHYAVHAPWETDDRFYQRYKDAKLEEREAVYASMIEGMDKSLGDIRANLERHGIADNTIIIFMSDNGTAKQLPLNLPLRGHKLTPYEGGIRVPMMVKWPGVTKPGSICDTPVIIEDYFPTLLEMAGVRTPEQIGGHVDGISFAPLLRGGTKTPGDRALVWHFPHCYDQPPYSVIREGDWKLIYFHLDQRYELYNLREDIGEKTDLCGRHPDTAMRLANHLHSILAERDAQMPVLKTTGLPAPLPGDS
jgi:arylsulfatase A-like enzyme